MLIHGHHLQQWLKLHQYYSMLLPLSRLWVGCFYLALTLPLFLFLVLPLYHKTSVDNSLTYPSLL